MKRALVLLALIAGCGQDRTEVVVTVHASGIRIPDDVDTLRLQIADRNGGADDLLFDHPVLLCSDVMAGTGSGCYTLPVTATLYPGSDRPKDSVRIQVDAQRHGTSMISDAALFTFSEGHSLRLDVILYANCLGNVDCAKRDQACGPDNMCTSLVPTPLGDEPDLATIDLAAPPPDLTNVHDFSLPADMTLPDLSGVDLLGCVPQCGGKQCGFDGCQGTCGNCPSHSWCDGNQQCAPCGTLGMGCCPPGISKPAGGRGHDPGPFGVPLNMGCDPGLECDTNTICNPPPDLMPPPPDMTMCGTIGLPCCNGVNCAVGICMGNLICDYPPDMLMEGGMDMMLSCSFFGAPCCPGTPDYCVNGYTCVFQPDAGIESCGP